MSMFGALNRFIARLDSDPAPQNPSSANAFGFQILRNTNEDLPLQPWFDFIIGINGRTLDSADPSLFSAEVRNSAGSTISLGIWSAKGERIREIYVPVPSNEPSIGLSLQWTPLSATEDVWHILEVAPNSPADNAGLLPYGDYIIGSPDGLVQGESGLSELVEDYIDRPLRLHVYNHEYSVARPVTITPSRSWGGSGALGCVLGYGALHRLPASLDEPPQAPGETLFETVGRFSNEEDRSLNPALHPADLTRPPQHSPQLPDSDTFVVPANMPSLTSPQLQPPPTQGAPPPTAQAGRPRKQRPHHVLSPGNAMDEYFKEGEQKSREQDYSPKPRADGLPPPPPKTGAPGPAVLASSPPPPAPVEVAAAPSPES